MTLKAPRLMLMTFLVLFPSQLTAQNQVGLWMTFETSFQSDRTYENPLYDVDKFVVRFTSPSGRTQTVSGFWDGGTLWKVRFAPDELGSWTYRSSCSDTSNSGLHEQTGSFEAVRNNSEYPIYQKGRISRPAGRYYLTYADGTPFFWTADTAWNGALKSTDEEWRLYLEDRVRKGYNTIQFVTTQWRGGASDRRGQTAFEGAGRIRINPEFFQRLDRKVDRINEYGLVAAPVLLWALPFGAGRHLSPGYYLPEPEAILLARYMVARYGGHQVVWILGGDGRYIDEYEQRWKNIGRGVFGDEHPGIVAQHPHGRSWIGEAYAREDWLDIVGYQSSHSKAEATVNWINKGPVSEQWDNLPARPIINMEPIYEEIHEDVTDRDVRSACYWSVFAAPPAGITYGANGIWPWRRKGEKILHHRDAPWTSTWRESLDLPGSRHIGYLAGFMQRFKWWTLKPAHEELLVEQPGDEMFNHFVSVLRSEDFKTLLVYIPVKITVRLYNPQRLRYQAQWFDPASNEYQDGPALDESSTIEITSPSDGDHVLVLNAR